MIGHMWFETLKRVNGVSTVDEMVRPQEDYGLYLKSYDAPPPKPKVYRTKIEGRDGTLDLTEWEGNGITRFEDRTVSVSLLDMSGQPQTFISKMLGKRVRVHFDDEPGHYYEGRVEECGLETRKHVSTIDMTITCYPFRYDERLSHAAKRVTVSAGSEDVTVSASGNHVVPTFTVSGCESGKHSYVSNTETGQIEISNGTFTLDGFYFTDGMNTFTITNGNATDALDVECTWRDEVI